MAPWSSTAGWNTDSWSTSASNFWPVGAKSYYEFTTDRGYSGGTVQPSSTSDFTMVRAAFSGAGAGSGSGYDLAGTTNFAANAFRRTSAGLLIEPSGLNAMQNSVDVSGGTWAYVNATAAAAATTAPDGTSTGGSITDNTTSARHIAYNQQGVGSSVYTFSAYLKQSTLRYVQLLLGSTNGFGAVFDLQAGTVTDTKTVGSPTSTASSIAAVGGGWYRCSVSETATTGAFTTVNTSNSGTPSYDVNGNPTYAGTTQAAFVWGIQLEISGAYTSYIPSTTTPGVTRAADAATVTLPAGTANIKYTFDDASTQTVSASTGSYTIPTNLNRSLIASMLVT